MEVEADWVEPSAAFKGFDSAAGNNNRKQNSSIRHRLGASTAGAMAAANSATSVLVRPITFPAEKAALASLHSCLLEVRYEDSFFATVEREEDRSESTWSSSKDIAPSHDTPLVVRTVAEGAVPRGIGRTFVAIDPTCTFPGSYSSSDNSSRCSHATSDDVCLDITGSAKASSSAEPESVCVTSSPLPPALSQLRTQDGCMVGMITVRTTGMPTDGPVSSSFSWEGLVAGVTSLVRTVGAWTGLSALLIGKPRESRTQGEQTDEADASHGPKDAYIMTFAVLPQYRNCGIGRALLSATCAYLQNNRRCKSVSLHCLSSNAAARRLYSSMGFQVVETLPSHYFFDGLWHDGLLLRKKLLPQPHTSATSTVYRDGADDEDGDIRNNCPTLFGRKKRKAEPATPLPL
jgi:ribosomal protein S18 acetylase RimI-like enzyme